MTKRRKQAIILLALSVPMMWWGFTNFMSGTTSNTALAIGTAIGCVFGAFSAISGLTMLITKNSLGILNPDDKGRGRTFDELTSAEKDARIASIEKEKAKGRGEDLLASQTKVGYSPILDKDKIRQRNQAAIDNLVTKTTDNAIKTLTKKQKVKPMAKANTSVELMKREKELETRRKELEAMLAEVSKEEQAVEKELKSKGWVQQKDGSWRYE